MKAQSLWAGTDYAWIEDRGRDMRYSGHVKRVRIIRVFQRQHVGRKNASTYADVSLLDWDGNTLNKEISIRAYDIVDFWDSFADEYADRLESTREYERKRKEEEAQYEKNKAAAIAAIEGLHEFLALPGVAIQYTPYRTTIIVPTSLIKEKLINNEQLV